MSRIFIIGMPGSGKSTVGELLAVQMKLPFFDLDEVIVEQEGASVSSIFEVEGETYFRQVESKCLEDITNQNGSFVMATGGGSPCYHNGIDWMNTHGQTVFIDVLSETLIERISKQEVRPLLKANPGERIKKLYEKRLKTYQKARMHIEASHLSVQKAVDRIIEELKSDS